ncbi:MAG: hypothetical protein U5K30_12365 [Acidimicrobiales bacterium]|nr:hypothetical protein [Acidimicrobiales bacterium]
MGQSVTVIAKHSSNPEMLRFEINRSLTGMGHERFRSLDDIVRNRAVDELARRLLSHGGVDAVHVNSSVITVDLAGGSTGDGLQEIIENMFRYYGEDVTGPVGLDDTPQDLQQDAAAEAAEAADGGAGAEDDSGSGDAGGAGDDEAVATTVE